MQTPERSEILLRLADLENGGFEQAAWTVFYYQARHNPLYARFLELLGRRTSEIQNLMSVPFLPIQFFKTQEVKSGSWLPQTVFTSSATTGQTPSRHLVRDLGFYLENARSGFARQWGDPSEWCILALLPSYLERSGSSLVAMADDLIRQSKYPESGFFLHDLKRLHDVLVFCKSSGYKTLLLGVSFALLDFAEQFPMDLSGITVMETGGMKGRRRELTRAELHETLCAAFQLTDIYSEYGMTELFSQAYTQGGPLFTPAPTLRVVATEINDPFCPVAPGRTGVLNIIDLANLDTCSFIQTE
ncbi:MAG TPA: acyl transferase, partial [Saprospiraceae bacterium]|nr:acyl transferase [Saprospiraceae bacterium]